MPHNFTILHLSDLHERATREKEGWRRRRVLGDSFLINLDDLLQVGAVDLVCFTGDLADWGVKAEYDAAAEFLAAVMDRVKLPRERLFLVPGNHDIQRMRAADSWSTLRSSFHLHDELRISRWLAGGASLPGLRDEDREAVLARQQAFRDFLTSFGLAAQRPESSQHGRLGYRQSIRLPGRPFDVHIIGLDSAWLSGDTHDARKLRLTEDQVMRLCSQDGKPLPGYRLALVHHPLTDLADGATCRRRLAEQVDLLLRGHLHEPEPERWADPQRQLLQFAAGCLYEGDLGDTHPNACQTIKITADDQGRPLEYALHFRAFSPQGGHWHADSGLYRAARNGRLSLGADGQVIDPSQARHFFVPFAENLYFTGREQLLREIAAALAAQKVAAVVQPQALSGLGGVGKTQLAVAYAYRYRHQYQAVFWVHGESEDSLRSSFATLADQLSLPGAAVTQSLDDNICAARRWLETNGGWLLIIDGADQPEALPRFLPRTGRGHVLLTSRAHDFQRLGLVCPLEVGALPLNDAVEFLIRRTGRTETNAGERAAAHVLAAALDGLPLALEQAAAFIVTNAAPIAEYLTSFQRHPLRSLSRSYPLLGGYPHTVATTWHMNFEQLKHSSASAAMLRLMAFLAPDAIPIELVIAGAGYFDRKLERALKDTASDPVAISAVIEPLLRYSLIRRDRDQRTVSVHRMVQEVIKDSLDPQVRKEYARRVVRALSAKFPDPAEHTEWPDCERFLRHALVAIAHCSEHEIDGEEAARLHNQVALYLDHRMQWQAAEPLFHRAIALRKKIEKSPKETKQNRVNLTVAQCNLSTLLAETGRTAEAIALMDQAIQLLETKDGEEDPALAWPLCVRAQLSRQAGQYQKVESLLFRALRLAQQDAAALLQCGERILTLLALNAQDLGQYAIALQRYLNASDTCLVLNGQDSPQYLHIQVNLGSLQRLMGQYEDAEVAARKALAQMENMVGREHNQYANAAGELAAVLVERGRYDEAQKILREELEIWRRLYGPEHNQVAGTLRKLAACLRLLGRNSEAVTLGEQGLGTEESLVGADHPSLHASLNELGLSYLALERFDDAERIFLRSLSLGARSYGEESSQAEISHNNLALVHEARGHYPLALKVYEHSLAIQRKCRGDEHPETFVTQYNIAHLLAQLSRHQEAQQLFMQVLAGWRKAYGEFHPQLAMCLYGLAQVTMALGDGATSERYLKESLGISEKVHDPEHSDRAQSLAALGQHYEARGRYQEALPYYERAFAILSKNEPESMVTATIMSSLGDCLTGLERYDEAEQLLRRAILQKESRLGLDHPDLATSLADLSNCLAHQDQVEEAETLSTRALSIIEKSEGTANPHYATALSNLASLRREQGRLDDATALEQQALQLRQTSFGPTHPEVAMSHGALGELASLRGEDNAARELLERARLAMPKSSLPYLQGKRAMRAGLAQARVGDLRAATKTLQEAVAAIEMDHESTAPERLQGWLSLIVTQLERGDLQGAEDSLQKIRELIARMPDPPLDARLTFHRARATLLRYRGDFAAARRVLKEALREGDAITADTATERIALLSDLGGVFEKQGEPAAAVPHYEEALQLLHRVVDRRQQQVLEVGLLANLASNHFQQDHEEKADALYQRVDRILDTLYSDKHPQRVLILQQRAAQALARQRWPLAKTLLERATERAKGVWADEHPDWGLLYRHLGKACGGCGEIDSAADYFKKALQQDERTQGIDSPRLRDSLRELAELEVARKDLLAAAVYAEKAALISRRQQPANPCQTFSDEIFLGFLLSDAGKREDALIVLSRALTLSETTPALAQPSDKAVLHIAIGDLLFYRQEISSARSHQEEAIRIFEEHPPKTDHTLHRLAEAHHALASCFLHAGQVGDASTQWTESLRVRRLAKIRQLGEEALTLTNLAQLLWPDAQHEQAAPLLREALDLARQAEDSWAYVLVGRSYARVLKELKQLAEERELLDRLLPASIQIFGQESELTQEISARLATMSESPQAENVSAFTKQV